LEIGKSKTLDLEGIFGSETMATEISNHYVRLNSLRSSWLNEKSELRNYLFATDTRKTSNSKLPWKNSTTIPKLCQIRDNLHANYMAALFPNSEWLDWEGDNEEAEIKEKADVIKAFMLNKTKASGFMDTVSQLVLDWIDCGNIFATVEFVNETVKNKQTGEEITGYIGPKLVRISPYDIVFDPTAVSFNRTPKIIRSLKTLGMLKKEAEGYTDPVLAKKAFGYALRVRKDTAVTNTSGGAGSDSGDVFKDLAFGIDGFGSWQQYFASGLVEVLEFYGDMYDVEKDELLENHIITVIDRNFIIRKEPNPNWLGRDHFYHEAWRKRPDNLYGMGPLDNLVGMQYRIDHLENLKADAFDVIAFPMLKIRGDVEAFVYQPGERIYVGDEGDVDFMHPDVTALAADNQIAMLEQKMEDLAGAPRQAMGIRTPGEKTAYEVSTLENAASRIFQNKTLTLEQNFLTDVLNAMLEVGRRNISTPELIKVLPSDIDAAVFQTITKEDITASGKLRPVGASHFAKRALFVQNLNAMLNSAIGTDPAINVHISGLRLAEIMQDTLELKKFDLVRENVRVFEQMETQRLINEGREQLQTEAITPPGLVEGDVAA
jgi:hypothetical protein